MDSLNNSNEIPSTFFSDKICPVKIVLPFLIDSNNPVLPREKPMRISSIGCSYSILAVLAYKEIRCPIYKSDTMEELSDNYDLENDPIVGYRNGYEEHCFPIILELNNKKYFIDENGELLEERLIEYSLIEDKERDKKLKDKNITFKFPISFMIQEKNNFFLGLSSVYFNKRQCFNENEGKEIIIEPDLFFIRRVNIKNPEKLEKTLWFLNIETEREIKLFIKELSDKYGYKFNGTDVPFMLL